VLALSVLHNGSVQDFLLPNLAFIDHWGMQGRSFDDHPELLRGQFGGTPAPTFRLHFAGDQVTIAD